MMRNAVLPAALIAALLGVSACAGPGGDPSGVVTVTRAAPTTRDALAISTWRYMASRGPVLVEVHGAPAGTRPAGTRPDRLDEAVVRRLRAPYGRAPVRFTTDPAAAGTTDQRVVLLFGVPLAVDGRVACGAASAAPAGGDPARGRLVLEAALCSGESPVTHARVTGPAATGGLDDPALLAALDAAMRHLVPYRDRAEDDHDICALPPC